MTLSRSILSGFSFVAITGLCLAQPASAAIIAVDINSSRASAQPDGSPSPTASGFTAFDAQDTSLGGSTTQQSAVIGAHTVTVNSIGGASFQTRDRQNVAGTFANDVAGNLLRDGIQADGGTPGSAGINLEITGFTPNTSYYLTVWLHDVFNNGAGDAVSIRDVNNANAVIGSGNWPGTPTSAGVDLSTSRFIVTALTDNSGMLDVDLIHFGNDTGGAFLNGALPLNGLEVNEIPEPATLSLLGLACTLTLRRRR